jgi:hypothetical protein
MYSIMVQCEVDGCNNVISSHNGNRTTPLYPPHAVLLSLTECPVVPHTWSTDLLQNQSIECMRSTPASTFETINNAIEKTRESIQ